MSRAAVYRHFAADGSLLYVGRSINPIMRSKHHLGRAPWAGKIASISVEWFETEDAADKAEKAAIRSELPPHNRALTINTTAAKICDMLGRAEMGKRLGVKLSAVSNASVGGSFPPAWFDVLDEMCRERGIDCPRSAFRFRSSESAA